MDAKKKVAKRKAKKNSTINVEWVDERRNPVVHVDGDVDGEGQ